MRKKSEQNATKCEKVAQDPPKRSNIKKLDGIREASSEGLRPSQGRFRREVGEVASNTLGGRGPPRIGTLRGASRDSAGVLT